MNKLLLAVVQFVVLANAGSAGTVEQQLLASLKAQGYVVVEQSYTFFGRLRVVAQNGDVQREIVVNPGTGEILRDSSISVAKSGPAATASVAADPEGLEPGQTADESAPADQSEADGNEPAAGAGVPAVDPGVGDAPQADGNPAPGAENFHNGELPPQSAEPYPAPPAIEPVQ